MAKPKKIPARPDTWMPMYWGDYYKDTNHLSTLEHGTYLLLIGHYWSTGRALPDDDEKLAQISRQPIAQWRKMRATLAEFFVLQDGKWHQTRVEEELTRAFDFLEKQTENGAKGGRPRNPTNNPTNNPNETQPITQHNPIGFARPKPNITTSPSPKESESSSSKTSTDPARGSALDVGSAPRAKGASDRIVAELAKNRHMGNA
jgi:uncharacterized protein YdaU (DUF1376 family)